MVPKHRRRINTEEKAVIIAAVWETYVFECRTSHLAAKNIKKKFLTEHPFFEGGGMVCNVHAW